MLLTKLHIPSPRPGLVPRPRLINTLNAGLGDDPERWARKVTLVSAPAGFGKTTLVATWLRQIDHRHASTAWLSLDADDNDPSRFLAYLLAAMQPIDARIGQQFAGMTQALPLPPAGRLLTPLVNDLDAAPPLILVLDDVHLLSATRIHELIAQFVHHQPPHVHLVLSGRGQPAWLPLARLRAHDHVSEVRAQALRFTPEETEAFFSDQDLSGEEVAALETRTEGWIAGLQLAALALPGRGDRNEFIRAFAGDDRYLADYLAGEVLRHLAPETQQFLQQTAILDQLCGPLCDALTGRDDGQATLERLERDGLFITPLDNQRRWYRYHPLFAQFLRARLCQVQSEMVPTLHRHASRWYAQHEMPHAAVRHALAMDSPEYALALIDRYDDWLFRHGEITTLIDWLRPFQTETIYTRPGLALSLAWAWLIQGETETASAFIAGLEPHLAAEHVGELLALRAGLARHRGDLRATRTWGERALDELDEAPYLRGIVTLFLSDLLMGDGQADKAETHLTETLHLFRTQERPYLETQALYRLINLHSVRGQLHQAAALCEEAFATMARHRLPYVVGGFHQRMGEVQWEWNELDAAARYLQEGIDIGKRGGHVPMLAANTLLLAQVRQAQEREAEMEALLAEARALAVDAPPVAAWLTNWQAWAALRRGQTEPAARWVADRGLSPTDSPNYHTLPESLLLLRLLMVRGEERDARRMLDKVMAAAERVGVCGVRIQLLLYLAELHIAQGRMAVATKTMERALALGEPGGYVRRFVDDARPGLGILVQLRDRYLPDAAPYSLDYLQRVLAAFGGGVVSTAPDPSALAEKVRLNETLTRRELEILQLMGRGLSNPQIAERLYISTGTVRWHVKNVYRKLEVNNRVQATVRAQDTGLLP